MYPYSFYIMFTRENGGIPVDYVWLDSDNNFRWKTRILNTASSVDCIPEWNYDGSSCGQADGNSQTEVIIKPVFMIKDPFRKIGATVLCETFKDDIPLINNSRSWAKKIFEKGIEEKPWFGIEQEYFIIDPVYNNVIGCTTHDFSNLPEQGKFYCKMGQRWGRSIAEKHMQYCLNAGLTVSGMNAEVAPGQWEYQIGPVEGIHAADELMLSRYILERIAEEEGKSICWDPKPIENVNGSGCHTNFSTENMRNDNGINEILNAIARLQDNHDHHMKSYGKGNGKRMTGIHETAKFDKFTFGYGTRNTSIRIGNDTVRNEKGYFEDRRPASNMDPYLVTGLLFKTACDIRI